MRESSNRNGVKKTTSGFDLRKGARLPASEVVVDLSRSGRSRGRRRRREEGRKKEYNRGEKQGSLVGNSTQDGLLCCLISR